MSRIRLLLPRLLLQRLLLLLLLLELLLLPLPAKDHLLLGPLQPVLTPAQLLPPLQPWPRTLRTQLLALNSLPQRMTSTYFRG